MKRISVLVLTALGTLAACEPAPSNPLSGRWRVVDMSGAAIPPQAEMRVDFVEEGRIEGHGGCNGFSVAYERTADGIAVADQLTATKMYCDATMQAETQLFALLPTVTRVERTQDGRLRLAGPDGRFIQLAPR